MWAVYKTRLIHNAASSAILIKTVSGNSSSDSSLLAGCAEILRNRSLLQKLQASFARNWLAGCFIGACLETESETRWLGQKPFCGFYFPEPYCSHRKSIFRACAQTQLTSSLRPWLTHQPRATRHARHLLTHAFITTQF